MIRRMLMILPLLLGGCGYSDEDLKEAYNAGHRAGIIWCKRQNEVSPPELADELLAQWQAGFRESTSIQCPSAAAGLNF